MTEKPTDEELEQRVKELERTADDCRQVEKKLYQKSAHLESIFKAIPDATVFADLDRRILLANTALTKVFGYEQEEVIGKYTEILYSSKESYEEQGRIRFHLSAEEKLKPYEVMYRRKDGGIFPSETVGTAVKDNEGNTIGFLGIMRDVTDRKQAEEALQRLHNKLEMRVEERTAELVRANKKLKREMQERKQAEKEIAELSIFPEMNPAPVVKIERKGIILLFNRSAQNLFKKANLLGKQWKVLCPECEEAGFPQALNSKEAFQHECRIMNKHFLFTYKKIPDSELVFIFGADITSRKHAEDLLQKAHNELEMRVKERTAELVKAKEDLLEALVQVKQLKNRLQAENVYLQEEIKLNLNFEEIIGRSNAIKKVLSKVEQVAATDATVLIMGETGTGKELFARAIHNLSPRNDRALVKVNCAALQHSLIESELFGHEKGSFTGAFSQRIGRFELANNGAIFLDEVGDLTLELQSKLLRVIQEGEFERLGGSRTINVNVRVIAATHKDLEKAIKTGEFRQDLYYRLNVFPIILPPLRKRRKDIPFLTKHFVEKYSVVLGKTIDSIPQKVMDALQAYPWPGNVRELENITERAVIMTHSSTLQLDESIVRALKNGSPEATVSVTLEEMQRNHILNTLKETNWRIEGKFGAAERLGINASTLRSRMRKLSITKPWNIK